jgi:DNA-binding winged helix-turn-helix (wHTH) protein
VQFDFGPFRLDEPARVLRLHEREVALQPRAFDLLVYLVRSRDRVVSKDELLDRLWPGVTVTDNSLQRAVSKLRGVLREGGMEDAIRNFPRSGYRFCLDEIDTTPASATPEGIKPRAVQEARRAVGEERWTDAIAVFEQTDAIESLAGSDLDLWALALQCIGNPSGASPVLARAMSVHAESGNVDSAAIDAATLCNIHLERGDLAVAKGWLARAQALTSAEKCKARGYVVWAQSRIAAAEGNPQAALDLASEAYEFGRKHKDTATEALGLMYRGFYRLSLGETRNGLADQDHAATLGLSAKLDPMTGGVLYCNILWACRTFGDWARASQWTVGYQKFCNENRMGFSGSCQLHRAEVLGTQGSLIDAKEHIDDALNKLTDDAPWATGDAYRVLGDIHAAIGNSDAAIAAYDKSYALGWDPEPGRAMLMLERGETAAAYASLERSLIGQSWWTLQRQGMLLAHLALVAAHAGRQERAQALIDDLAGNDQRWPMASIRALTNEAAAILARERGKLDDALRHLHLARQLWTSVGCRLNATRLRLQIAAVQMELGDEAGAATELRTALAIAAELKSGKLVRQCEELRQELAPASRARG